MTCPCLGPYIYKASSSARCFFGAENKASSLQESLVSGHRPVGGNPNTIPGSRASIQEKHWRPKNLIQNMGIQNTVARTWLLTAHDFADLRRDTSMTWMDLVVPARRPSLGHPDARTSTEPHVSTPWVVLVTVCCTLSRFSVKVKFRVGWQAYQSDVKEEIWPCVESRN